MDLTEWFKMLRRLFPSIVKWIECYVRIHYKGSPMMILTSPIIFPYMSLPLWSTSIIIILYVRWGLLLMSWRKCMLCMLLCLSLVTSIGFEHGQEQMCTIIVVAVDFLLLLVPMNKLNEFETFESVDSFELWQTDYRPQYITFSSKDVKVFH